MPEETLPDDPVIITRESLRDGTLLMAARERMPPGTVILSDAVIAADLEAALASHPPGEDVWLFGYGSLMWNPAMEFAESRPAVVRGWHRQFCLWLHGGRGTPEKPGLMLALERGGSCAGLLFRIPAAEARDGTAVAVAARAVHRRLPLPLGHRHDRRRASTRGHLRREPRS